MLFSLLSLLATAATPSLADAVLGCSGYVRSDFAVDFSQINVGLFTEHGSQRDTTDCAPSTGYFFLPVEQLGKYILKVIPPPGWTVSPPEMIINVDGKSDACSLNQDIIFHFSGFSIFGQVSSKDKEAGPTGLSISLYKKGSQDLISSALSDSNGNFEFKGLKPDSYTVGLGVESLESFSFEKRDQDVRVEHGSVRIPPFVIIGYDVEGSVVDRNGKAIVGVGLDLLSDQGGELKAAVSDAAGRYRFSNVSRGAYVVRPSKSNLDVLLQPEVLAANVFDKNVNVEKFQVREFVLRGKVLWNKEGSGAPMGGVTVTGKQDGHLHSATSSENGEFTLKGALMNEMVVSCVLDGVEFEDVVVQVQPSANLPPLIPARYRVKGTVEMGDSSSVVVSFKRVKSADQGQADLKATAVRGTFEVYLPRGEYKASVASVDSKDAENYLPKETALEVKDGPQEGISFQLARFVVSGTVKCFDPACHDVVVLLSAATDAQPVAQSVVKGTFTFPDVRQGNYVVSLKPDSRCWSTVDRSLSVKSDIKDVTFQQVGNQVTVIADHDTKLVLKDVGGKVSHTFDLTKGEKKICVEGSEQLSVSTEGCYGFRSSPEVLNLGKDDSLKLTTVSYKILGQVITASEIPDLQVKASSSKRKEEALKLTKNERGYHFQLDAEAGENLALHPSSKNTFFDPTVQILQVKDSCNDNTVDFHGREGVFIQGFLVPPVQGALVQVPEGSEGKVTTAFSEKDGSFKIGPFVDDSPKKSIEVSKEGYFFEATDTYGTFSSKQLSSITIVVKDQQGRVLPEDAVIAISGGGAGFKNSLHTNAGSVKFTSLHPGEYFVKAFLKEWVFEPKNIIVRLQENKDEVRDLVGKRVAFSALGEVVYLNGHRAAGVVVLGHGRGQSCLDKVEDSMTAADGIFRLRGLEPNCSYDLESGSKDIQTFITRTKSVKVETDDLRLPARVIAHGRPEVFHFSIKVKAKEPSSRKSVTVKVSAENDLVPAKLFNLSPNQLTALPPLPVIDVEYTVKFDGKVIKRIPAGSAAFQYLQLDLNEEESKTNRRESGSKFYFVVPLAMVAVAAVALRRFYQKKE